VAKYLKAVHGTKWAEEIMSDIDRRYVTSFISSIASSHNTSELLLYLHSLVCDGFPKAVTSNSGQAMIRKLS
jgi:hypothetical protein